MFAHYRVDADTLRPLIPSPLKLQEFDGSAWIGVVPFYLVIRPRWSPNLPGLSCFPEINVRTYVELDGKPGVWFFSLDASNRFAVWAANTFFSLPYFNAAIDFEKSDEAIKFSSTRKNVEQGSVAFAARYRPLEALPTAQPGSIEHFLTERYCLYTTDRRGRLYRLDVHHEPWVLFSAEATIDSNTMTLPIDVPLDDQTPLLHYADKIDVICWLNERVSGESRSMTS